MISNPEFVDCRRVSLSSSKRSSLFGNCTGASDSRSLEVDEGLTSGCRFAPQLHRRGHNQEVPRNVLMACRFGEWGQLGCLGGGTGFYSSRQNLKQSNHQFERRTFDSLSNLREIPPNCGIICPSNGQSRHLNEFLNVVFWNRNNLTELRRPNWFVSKGNFRSNRVTQDYNKCSQL